MDKSRIASETTPLIRDSKKPRTPLPKLQIGILLISQLAEPIASLSIFPYINQLIRDLGVTGDDGAAVGYYAGIIDSLFFVGQALTALRWSRLSDRIGRKPVLLMGVSGAFMSILCFGLSTNFWSLVVSRFMCGILNGNAGVMKVMMGELTDSTNMAQGYALIPIVWYIGAFVGPLIGGTLARPQDHWPVLFSHPFWGSYPYFLPSAVSACLLFLAFMLQFLFLEEPSMYSWVMPTLTVAKHLRKDQWQICLCDLCVVIAIANHAMLSFLGISLMALLPLFLSTPTNIGGVGFTPSSIGSCLAVYSSVNSVFQALFFAKIVDRFGPKRLFCLSVWCFAPVIVVFPLISWLVRARGIVDHVVVFVLLGQLVLTVIWDMAYGTVYLFITASAPTKNVLGAIYGLSQTSASLSRAVGPALATSLFAFSKENNLLNGNAVYLIFIILGGVTIWLGSQLPDELQERDE